MKKPQISASISEHSYNYIRKMEEVTGLPKSRVLDLFISIVDTYFNSEQIKLEAAAMDFVDGRRKKSQG